MPRQWRIEYPGAIYHLVNRGNGREVVFRDDADREDFLAILGATCVKAGWRVHAFCLLDNHFHLVVETPQPNLVAGMKWFLGAYTIRFNRRHKLAGHLFAGRYKSLLVEGGAGYLRTVCDYVHLNPSRARVLSPEQPLRAYRWSSFVQYLRAPVDRLPWLRADRLLAEMGLAEDNAEGRAAFERQVEARRRTENSADWRCLRRGWCYGSTAFRHELLARMKAAPTPAPPAARRESAEIRAEGMIGEELRRLGWRELDLAARRKGDPEKIQIARRLRRETTVTLKWIAWRLQMGVWTYVANLIYASEADGPRPVRARARKPARRRRIPASARRPPSTPAQVERPVASIVPAGERAESPAPAPESAPEIGEEVLPVHCL